MTVPTFSFTYFIMSWVYMLLFILFTVYHAYKSNYVSQYLNNGGESESFDDEDDDVQAFIKASLDTAGNAGA